MTRRAARPPEIRRAALDRQRLVEIPSGTELLREVRYLPDEAFDEVSTEELELATRWLRAASYSAAEGARRLQRLVDDRTTTTTEEEGGTCNSNPNSTPTSTTTAGPPTDRPPASAP